MSTVIESSWENERLKETIESLRQQLAAALAACKRKDEALDSLFNMITRAQPSVKAMSEARSSRAIQPDDSALKAWLGEPVAWMRYNIRGELLITTKKPSWDESVWPPLYSPKGLKK